MAWWRKLASRFAVASASAAAVAASTGAFGGMPRPFAIIPAEAVVPGVLLPSLPLPFLKDFMLLLLLSEIALAEDED